MPLLEDSAVVVVDSDAFYRQRLLEVPLQEAQGLRLAEDLRADRNYPPFDKSLMDGFAVRCADLPKGELKVVGEIAAGTKPNRALGAGEAMAIMTGAPLPPGADCVVPVEETTRSGDLVRISTTSKIGKYIARCGSDAPASRPSLTSAKTVPPASCARRCQASATRRRRASDNSGKLFFW